MARLIRTTAILTVAVTIFFSALYRVTRTSLYLTLSITFGTLAYHIVMRIIVAAAFDRFMNNRADYHKVWYQVKPWEEKLYHILRVKQWKKYMPTYNRSTFDPRLHSWDEIAQATCQAELVHETNIVLSFLPILASIRFGALSAFVITSVLSAALDMSFVILQRYNRPRVIRCIENQKVRQMKKDANDRLNRG